MDTLPTGRDCRIIRSRYDVIFKVDFGLPKLIKLVSSSGRCKRGSLGYSVTLLADMIKLSSFYLTKPTFLKKASKLALSPLSSHTFQVSIHTIFIIELVDKDLDEIFSLNFIRDQLTEEGVQTPRRQTIYCHFIKAIDTKNIEIVFNSVKDILIRSYVLLILV